MSKEVSRVEIHIPKTFDGKAALYRAFERIKKENKPEDMRIIYLLYEDSPDNNVHLKGAEKDDLPGSLHDLLFDTEDDFDYWEDEDDLDDDDEDF